MRRLKGQNDDLSDFASRWYAAQDPAASTIRNYRRHIEGHLPPTFEDIAVTSSRRTWRRGQEKTATSALGTLLPAERVALLSGRDDESSSRCCCRAARADACWTPAAAGPTPHGLRRSQKA